MVYTVIGVFCSRKVTILILFCSFFKISVDAPEITQHPKSHSIAIGIDTTFTVEATGDDIEFQWQKDGVDVDCDEPRLCCNRNGNVSTLHIQYSQKCDTGCYRCVVKNPVEKSGKFSKRATLSVCKFVNINVCGYLF